MQVTGAECRVPAEISPPEAILKIGVQSVSDNAGSQQLDGRRVARMFGHLFGNELAVAIRERAAQLG